MSPSVYIVMMAILAIRRPMSFGLCLQLYWLSFFRSILNLFFWYRLEGHLLNLQSYSGVSQRRHYNRKCFLIGWLASSLLCLLDIYIQLPPSPLYLMVVDLCLHIGLCFMKKCSFSSVCTGCKFVCSCSFLAQQS